MERVRSKQIGNISVKPISWEKDIYKDQILVGDSLSINEEQIAEHCLTVLFEVKDREGKIIFRGVKTHPEDKFKFDIGSKVNGKIVKGCVITTP